MGAEYLFYMESIETHARAFSRLISDGIGGVGQLNESVIIFELK